MTDTPSDHWTASAARQDFSGLVDAAAAGRPQTVRRRDGREVVVVSREYFEKTRPTLKSVLLTEKARPGDPSLADLLRDARNAVGDVFAPHAEAVRSVVSDHSGHGRPEPAARRKRLRA